MKVQDGKVFAITDCLSCDIKQAHGNEVCLHEEGVEDKGIAENEQAQDFHLTPAIQTLIWFPSSCQ